MIQAIPYRTRRRKTPDVNFKRLAPPKRDGCRISLAEFVRAAWHVVEQERPLIWSKHLDAICEHLEAVADGRIRDMLITIPPGTSKSRIVGVFWPAWVWLKRPHLKWLFVSNSDDAATTDSTACRALVESDWYRHNFGITWELRGDQNTKLWYETTKGGHRIALGIDSNITARKGDIVVVDDANDATTVESAAVRRRVNRKYDASIWDRVINFASGQHVIVGQRTHEDDLIGHVIRTRNYFELRIPEEFNPSNRFRSPIGWTDWRTKRGEMLRPLQFPASLAVTMRRVDLMMYQAKHLQEPRSREGVRFKGAWLQKAWVWDTDREHILLTDERGTFRFHAWNQIQARFGTADPAASAKTSADFTVVSSWILTTRGDLLWIGCRRIQAEIPEQPELLAEEYVKHKMQWCSVEAVASNRALLQHAQRTNMTVQPVSPGGADKLARATPAIILTEAGGLWLPDTVEAERSDFPIDAVVDELTAFTGDPKKDKHDDVIDTLSYAVQVRHDLLAGNPSQPPTAMPGPKPGDWAKPNPPIGPSTRPRGTPSRPIGPTWHGR